MFRLTSVASLALAVVVGASPAVARGATLTTFPIPTAAAKPTQVITGPDGRLWFTQTGAQHEIGRFDPNTGAFAPIRLTPAIDEATTGDGVTRLAVATNGYVWALDNGGQELFKVSASGVATQVLPYGGRGLDGTSSYDDALQMPDEIVPALGGGVWTLFPFHNPSLPGNEYNGATTVSDAGAPALVTNQTYEDPHPAALDPRDGSVWVVDYAYVTHIASNGAVARYPTGLNALYAVSSVLPGPDGTLWFSAYQSGSWLTSPSGGVIGRLANGQVQTTALNSRSAPSSLRFGPEGALWWSELLSNTAGQPQGAIGRMDPANPAAFQEGSVGNYKPAGIAFAPNGGLWFVDTDANVIANVALDGQLFPQAPPPAPPAPAPAPALPAAPKPKLRVSSAKLKTVASKRRLTVRCALPAAGTCTVKATIAATTAKRLKLAKKAKKAYTLASAHKRLSKKGTASLTLKLSKSEASKLRRSKHSVKVTLMATSTAAGHTPVTAKRTLKLKR
jgi:virginiamycin B lyase